MRRRQLVNTLWASQLFVAACAVALAMESSWIAARPLESASLYAVLFFATLCSYRLHARVRSAQRGRVNDLLTLAAALCGLALLPGLSFAQIVLLMPAAALAWLYSVPAWPGGTRLREHGRIKIITLAGVWALATGVVPLVDHLEPASLLLVGARRFLFVFSLCLLFDLRDISADRRAGIRTVPVRIGTQRTLLIAGLALLAFAGLAPVSVASAGEALGTMPALALTLSAACTWRLAQGWRPTRSAAFYLVGVDGMMLLQSGLVWLATHA